MYELSYIIHIVGVALWLGSFFALGFLLKSFVNRELRGETITGIIRNIQHFVMFGIVPAMVLIMATGIYMILQFEREYLPLYLTLMEQAGSIVLLLSILFVSIYSVKITKKLKGIELKKDKPTGHFVGMFSNYLLISAVLGVAVVVIVGLRL